MEDQRSLINIWKWVDFGTAKERDKAYFKAAGLKRDVRQEYHEHVSSRLDFRG